MDIKKATRQQWIKMSIIMCLYLLFLIWVRSWLGLLIVPFIFDAYITKKIPWLCWKESKNPTVRNVMSWIDAIVFALVAVHFVNLYLFQNYQIPTSSLEKSLLVGDFLYVSKVSYGPRVPNTPLSMPLTQHTMPVINTKSYLEYPQWAYKRVKGLGEVKLNDIVVFNFPAGDTVALNQQHTDYYLLAMREGKRLYPNKVNMDSLSHEQQNMIYDLYYNAGSKLIHSNPQYYGKVITRPVDRRENYVKRCVGLPGDTFNIVEGQIYIDGAAIENPEGLQFNYLVQTTGKYISQDLFYKLGISVEDQICIEENQGWERKYFNANGLTPNETGNFSPVYHLPLTQKMHKALLADNTLISQIKLEQHEMSDYIYRGDMFQNVYPINQHTGWTKDNYGPIWIPKKGESITLTKENIRIYERCIQAYEGNVVEEKEDGIYINGQRTDTYTFKMDYYWLMGDNRHNSLDSRYWGFVPEDHVVGKPIMVWLSLDKDRGWFNGKIRWNRIFKWVH